MRYPSPPLFKGFRGTLPRTRSWTSLQSKEADSVEQPERKRPTSRDGMREGKASGGMEEVKEMAEDLGVSLDEFLALEEERGEENGASRVQARRYAPRGRDAMFGTHAAYTAQDYG